MLDLLNKRLKVFYSDGAAVQTRLGTCTGIDADFITLEDTVLIPRGVIIRVEVTEPRGGGSL